MPHAWHCRWSSLTPSPATAVSSFSTEFHSMAASYTSTFLSSSPGAPDKGMKVKAFVAGLCTEDGFLESVPRFLPNPRPQSTRSASRHRSCIQVVAVTCRPQILLLQVLYSY